MADVAGSLTFRFGADFSGFTRAADSAGAQLDRLSQAAQRWSDGSARSLTVAGSTDQAGRVLNRLGEQLQLVRTTGAAHAAVAEQMRIEGAQARLGADATQEQKNAAESLVRQIDAAAAGQIRMRVAQQATNAAWRFGSDQLADGIEALVLRGEKLKDVAASILSSFAKQGLSAALTGSGPLAGLLGTRGTNGATGGLFGAIGALFTGGAGFAGLFAGGGTIAPGRWGVVGERGAEVVAGPATVIPWAKAVGQAGAQARPTQVIQFNVTTPDAPSFARSEAQMAALVSRAVARGGRNS